MEYFIQKVPNLGTIVGLMYLNKIIIIFSISNKRTFRAVRKWKINKWNCKVYTDKLAHFIQLFNKGCKFLAMVF